MLNVLKWVVGSWLGISGLIFVSLAATDYRAGWRGQKWVLGCLRSAILWPKVLFQFFRTHPEVPK